MALQEMTQELQADRDFSVTVYKADGTEAQICHNVTSYQASREFWRCCNNVSAKTGIVEQVSITDSLGFTVLAWRPGKGYTYDGTTYYTTPVVDS